MDDYEFKMNKIDFAMSLIDHYWKDAAKLGYQTKDLINIQTRQKIIDKIERGDAKKP